MEATTKDFRSRISAKITRCLWLWGKRKNHSRTDYCRYTGHSPETAKISSALPSHDQNVTALSVCPHPEWGTSWKDEFLHLEELRKELWLHFWSQQIFPAEFIFTMSSAQLSFVPGECTCAKNGWFVTNGDKVNGEEERQCLSKKPAHINSSTPCTGKSGLAPKDHSVTSDPQYLSIFCHWHKLLRAIPLILVIFYCQSSLVHSGQ